MSEDLLKTYRNLIIGMEVTNSWKGYGSVIFIELGTLHDAKNGNKLNNASGEYTIMVEWDWRIELERKILFGSSSEDKAIEAGLNQIIGHKISAVNITNHIPELEVTFSNNSMLRTFMTNEDDPQWAIMDYLSEENQKIPTLTVKDGKLISE